jgi:hypothetical protein
MIAANGRALSVRVVRPIYALTCAAAAVILSMVVTGLIYITVRLPVIPAGRTWIEDNCSSRGAVSNTRTSTLDTVCALATWRDR